MEQFLPDLWNLAKNAGIFATGFMFYAWWSERAERRSIQQQQTELLERTITSNNNIANGLANVNQILLQRTNQ